ncbi:MAG: hypothetical protein ACREER_02020, partial [Alphaproteobacteria bacterium]
PRARRSPASGAAETKAETIKHPCALADRPDAAQSSRPVRNETPRGAASPHDQETTMNLESILGIIRHALTFGGGFIVSAGWASDTDVATGVGALVTLIGLAWSVWSKRSAPAA